MTIQQMVVDYYCGESSFWYYEWCCLL